MKILIICAGGMSSSIVTKKAREAALRRTNENIIVDESATYDIPNKANEFDIFLVAPQVKYLVPNLKNQVNGKPVGLIPPAIYARMDGNKIIDFALSLVSNKSE